MASELARGKMSEAGAEVFKVKFAKRLSMKIVVNKLGNGCAKVGLIIAFTALIGSFLLEFVAVAKIVLVVRSAANSQEAPTAGCQENVANF